MRQKGKFGEDMRQTFAQKRQKGGGIHGKMPTIAC
jgi:hypothetical protein